ncbi:MAG: chromate resistance protein ChrB domain-containing protein [Pseudomonadota bacterium]
MGDFFISAEDLSHRLALAEPVRVFDVRRPPAIEPGSRFLPGSRWRNHVTALDWAGGLPRDRLIVLNCMHGHNVSQIATALLREAGYNARALAGGVDGWIEAGLPTVAQSRLCPVDAQPGIWVTRISPGIEHVACSWLISRFIDPDASFFFAEADWVNDIAQELSGIAIGNSGAVAEHAGELCSFDTLLREFDLNDPALAQLATIVRAAHSDRIDPAPEAAGLLAVMLGNSIVGKTDHDVLRLGFPVYDALYARLKLAGSGTGEPSADGGLRGSEQ